jgi:hypothetical protein
MKNNQYQDKVLDGRSYRIAKFSPEVASYWGFRLFGDLAAFGMKAGTVDGMRDELPKLIKDFTCMGRKEFAEFQKDCLAFVSVKFDLEGYRPLVNSEGFITVPEISNAALLKLTTESFMFTIADFFASWLQEAGGSPEMTAPSGPTTTGETGSETSAITP